MSGSSHTAWRLMQATGAMHYNVVIRQWRADGTQVVQPHIGPLSSHEVLARWRQWQRRNAACADILIRIADKPPPSVLIDDLDAEALQRLRSDLPVHAVVETSQGNYQAWVPRPLAVEALAWSRALAQRYGGDPGAVQARQPGRLPGLCNRKPRHARPDGRGPWIVLRHADPDAQPAGTDFLAAVLGEPRAPAAAAAVLAPSGELAGAAPAPAGRNRGGKSPSENDWAMARRMLASGLDVEQVETALLDSAYQRGKRGAEQYARRTARRAAGLPG